MGFWVSGPRVMREREKREGVGVLQRDVDPLLKTRGVTPRFWEPPWSLGEVGESRRLLRDLRGFSLLFGLSTYSIKNKGKTI